jgi:AcrR family transcriptional regulator
MVMMGVEATDFAAHVDVAGKDPGGVDPRIERSRQTVLTATIELLGEVGYGALAMEAVAARSGVAKSTIYRHWPNRDALVTDAFAALREEASTAPPPGPVRERATVLLRALALKTRDPDWETSACMPALIDGGARSSEMARECARAAEERSRPLVDVLEEGMRAGEIPPGDATVLADALFGPIILRKLFHREPFDPDDVPAHVERVLSGG